MNNPTSTKSSWDAALYQNQHGFVWEYGQELLQLLNPQAGELILDLGCGTGQLTQKIAQYGCEVLGIDNAVTMVEQAKENYPHLRFEVADAQNFQVEQPYDAVFSNAALHWVQDAERAIACIHRALKSGGRFVAEFGGKGNVEQITAALEQALTRVGISQPKTLNPWYFPSIGEYASKLESQGFDVIYASLFHRPTPLSEGEAGLENWIKMFGSSFLVGLSTEEQIQVIEDVENCLEPKFYHQGIWTADYRRLRIVALKIE